MNCEEYVINTKKKKHKVRDMIFDREAFIMWLKLYRSFSEIARQVVCSRQRICQVAKALGVKPLNK